MKIVTRSGVFETNSSSVHSYTYPIKSERISLKVGLVPKPIKIRLSILILTGGLMKLGMLAQITNLL